MFPSQPSGGVCCLDCIICLGWQAGGAASYQSSWSLGWDAGPPSEPGLTPFTPTRVGNCPDHLRSPVLDRQQQQLIICLS